MTIQERIEQAKAIYKNACDKGFHDPRAVGGNETDSNENEHSVEHYLMLVITELSEAVEAHRKGADASNTIDDYLEYGADLDGRFVPSMFEEHIKDTWQDELADVYIRLMDLMMDLINKDKHFSMRRFMEGVEGIRLMRCIDRTAFTKRCFMLVERISEVPSSHPEIRQYALFGIALSIQKLFPELNLDWHVAEKMKYNATRPRLHGKNY